LGVAFSAAGKEELEEYHGSILRHDDQVMQAFEHTLLESRSEIDTQEGTAQA
jgi:hypothetical protein